MSDSASPTRLWVSCGAFALALAVDQFLLGGTGTATAAGAGALLTQAGKVGTDFLSGLTGEIAGGFVHDWFNARPGRFQDMLQCEDLARAIGAALKYTLQEEADKVTDPEDRAILKAVAKELPKRWLEHPRPPISEHEAVHHFGVTADRFGTEPVLEPEEWRELLRGLLRESTTNQPGQPVVIRMRPLSEAAQAQVVQALHGRFLVNLQQTLLHDAHAYASLHLRIQGEILAAVKQPASDPEREQIREQLYRAALGALQSTLETMSEREREEHQQVIDWVVSLDDRLRDVLVEVAGTREAIAQVDKKLDLLTAMVRAKLAAPEPFAGPWPLPAFTRAFTGRVEEVTGVVASLREHRLVNLTGLGGIGKTEVSRAACHASVDEAWCRDGIYYFNLEAAASPDSILAHLITELGLQPGSTAAGVGRQLAGAKLFVLDDLYPAHSTDRSGVATLVRELLTNAGDARFLVTNRERLNLAGLEHTEEIRQLAPPHDAELFRRLSKRPAYRCQEGDEERLEVLIRELDGYPLALTIAAALLPGLGLEGLLELWRQYGVDALIMPGMEEEEIDRLNCVARSLLISFNTLPEGAPRQLFTLFADIPAGATRELLLEVMGKDAEGAIALLDRRSLIHREGERWKMLAPVREFAARMRTSELIPQLHRLNEVLAALTARCAERFMTDTTDVVRSLTAEMPNLHAALDRADVQQDHEYIARLTVSLSYVYPFAMPGAEAKLRLGKGVAAAEMAGKHEAQAFCLVSLGQMHRFLGEYAAARERLETALAVAVEISDRVRQANCLSELGKLDQANGELSAAQKRQEAAQSLFAEVGHTLGQAHCLLRLSQVHRACGEYGAAERRLDEAFGLYKELGDRLDQANCLSDLGDLHQARGENAAARERFEAALVLYEDIGDRRGQANCLKGLGKVHQDFGEYAMAQNCHEKAQALYVDVGDRLGQANCLSLLADIELMLGENAAARERFETALVLYLEVDDPLGQANCLWGLGRVHLNLREFSVAQKYQVEAQSLYQYIGDRQGQANCLWSLGNVHLSLGEYALAREQFETGLALCLEIDDRLGQANCLKDLGIVHQDLGQNVAARERFEAALAQYLEIGGRLGQANCLWGLGRLHFAEGDREGAIVRMERAAALYEEIGDRWATRAQALTDEWRNLA